MKITITDHGRVHQGTLEEAFDSLVDSFATLPPYATMEANDLRRLWENGDGYSVEAMNVCASLGVYVDTQP